MTLEGLISSYDYAAIGIGTFLEGETILVLGGFSAHRGYLDLPLVIFSGFLGTLLGAAKVSPGLFLALNCVGAASRGCGFRGGRLLRPAASRATQQICNHSTTEAGNL